MVDGDKGFDIWLEKNICSDIIYSCGGVASRGFEGVRDIFKAGDE